jgi:hypothetical protein
MRSPFGRRHPDQRIKSAACRRSGRLNRSASCRLLRRGPAAPVAAVRDVSLSPHDLYGSGPTSVPQAAGHGGLATAGLMPPTP